MNRALRVRRSPQSTWRDIDGEVAIISIDSARVRLLNETGSFVWKLCDGQSVDALADAVAQEYGVSLHQAREDVDAFVSDMAKRGLVVVEDR